MRVSRERKNQGDILDNTADPYFQGAGESQAHWSEHANAVTRSGQTPAIADGTGEDLYQTAKAMFINGVAGQSFQDNGTANAYQLTPLTGASGLVIPDYAQLQGAVITFKAGNAPTAASTVNIGQTTGTYLGTKPLLRKDGSALSGGEFLANEFVNIQYNSGSWYLMYSSLSLKALDGYQMFSSGLILQWGNETSGIANVVFPLTFPNSLFFVGIFPEQNNNSSVLGHHVMPLVRSVSGFSRASSGIQFSWIAIGH